MATTCIDKILCENAWDCNITVTDTDGNPINPLYLHGGDNVVFVLGEKIGYTFVGWCDENGASVYYTDLGNGRYLITIRDCDAQYFAKYCPIEYTVTATSSAPIECFTPYTTTANYGSIVRIRARETFTCHFINWTLNGNIVSEQPSFDYVVTDNVVFVANYETMFCRLTVIPNNRDRGYCTGGGNYVLNTNVTITAVPKTGYVFEKWDDGDRNSSRTVVVTGNKTYEANFVKSNVVVVVDSVSGGTAIGSGTYLTSEKVALQAIPDIGWKFSHWVINGEINYNKNVNMVAYEETNATPYFIPKLYSVNASVSPVGFGYLTPSPQLQYNYGDSFTVEAKPYNGYRFIKWEDGFSSPVRTINVVSDIKISALFEPKPVEHAVTIILPDDTYVCNVYYDGNNIGNQINNEVLLNAVEGTELVIVPSIPEGHKIVSVIDNNGNIVWNDETSIDSRIVYVVGNTDIELTVNYQVIGYSLKITLDPLNDAVSGNADMSITVGNDTEIFTPTQQNPVSMYTNVLYGTSISITTPSFIGEYAFSYWATDDGSFDTPSISFIMTQNTKCCAVYSLT